MYLWSCTTISLRALNLLTTGSSCRYWSPGSINICRLLRRASRNPRSKYLSPTTRRSSGAFVDAQRKHLILLFVYYLYGSKLCLLFVCMLDQNYVSIIYKILICHISYLGSSDIWQFYFLRPAMRLGAATAPPHTVQTMHPPDAVWGLAGDALMWLYGIDKSEGLTKILSHPKPLGEEIREK
jgi:hypothetical protein